MKNCVYYFYGKDFRKDLQNIFLENMNDDIEITEEDDKSIENKDKVILEIYDNGIGIPEKDLKRVFDKSFTGTNGRDKVKSTGMGLYIIKKLCNKLGHNISIESKENEYTKVILEFGKNDVYKF